VAPAAAPSPELIRQTLYYRQLGPPSGISPARWGDWWPFLAACFIAYGLLPRLVLICVAGIQFRRALRLGFIEMPGATLVVDRLSSERVTTQAPDAEVEPAGGLSAPGSVSGAVPGAEAGPLAVVNWGGLDVADATLCQRMGETWRREVLGVFHAGGRRPVEEDARTIARITEMPDSSGAVVLVKAWEPPMADLADFLRDLRQAIGPRRIMIVAPVDLDASGQFIAPRSDQTEVWRKRLRQIGDAALVVRPWPAVGGPA
jgi:hypothetical protein